MSFRNRLTLFFVVIVIVPMLAAAVILYLLTTDSILLTAAGNITNARPCIVENIVAGTSFDISCTANPGNGGVWNVLIIRQ